MNATLSPPFDLDALHARFLNIVHEERDPKIVAASDLTGCDYATHLRLAGEPSLPFSRETLASFEMGHAIEAWKHGMMNLLIEEGWSVTRGGEVSYRGVSGHPDFRLERLNLFEQGERIVIDVSTQNRTKVEVKEHHALKTWLYAKAYGAALFADIAFPVAFGQIGEPAWKWYATADHDAWGEARIDALLAIKAGAVPAVEPPMGENWRCGKPGSGKSYCNAPCVLNARYVREEIPSGT